MTYIDNMIRITNEITLEFEKNIIKKKINYNNINTEKLLILSNEMIHDSSIYQKNIILKFSTLIYCIAKMIKEQKNKKSNNLETIFCKYYNNLKLMYTYLKKNNINKFENKIVEIFNLILKNNNKFNIYIQDIINSTTIKKGSKLVDHGISIETVSKMTGLNQWELYNYLGKTNFEIVLDEKIQKTQKRLDHAKKIFNIK
ncbi:hypothetical protein HOC99_04645 [Candidatus Woesearchaeota archaeon]|jgi:hypothetical protein|nr:hypothetical protein [Candidatus Woesearchaeota archaeon]MBT4387050.1 hypothetical protein [Candidatus Woesearchaeota archaeon]MBT4596193.1 hypothetical protein [Candidatus Woesearchaeota archaeon]MBT5741584.1 hypothetical protein [Candidatus Woesearchaeota archaeon]MBT7849330.1 hypothetical protein [Candidatus Woesearchaeota archaeon]